MQSQLLTDDDIQLAHLQLYFVSLIIDWKESVTESLVFLDIASGGSEDWTAGVLNITNSFCLELPPTGGDGFVVPATEIAKTGNFEKKRMHFNVIKTGFFKNIFKFRWWNIERCCRLFEYILKK